MVKKLVKKISTKGDTKGTMIKEAFRELDGGIGVGTSGVRPVIEGDEVFSKDDSSHVDEKLTHDEEIEKHTYIGILKKWLKPLRSDKKPDAERDLYTMLDKLEKATLGDLKQFFEVDLPIDIRVALQDKYKDISP